MLVRDWMSTEVTTITDEASVMKAGKIMREKKIRRLPVVDKDMRLIGIVTEWDIKTASPSAATTLDMYEITHLLTEIKVREVMTKKPVHLHPEDSVEKAALIMRNRKIGGLPVVDDTGKVLGMLTDTDVFHFLISITGIDLGGVQMGFKLPVAEGSLKPILDDLRAKGGRIVSILSSYERSTAGERSVYIRIHSLGAEEEEALHKTLDAKYGLIFWTKDAEGPLT